MPNPLQKLLTMGEENLPALIKRLKGEAPEVEQAIARRAAPLEGEVVGDLVVQPAKKVLPDIEGELVKQKLLSAPVEENIAQQASEAGQEFLGNTGAKAGLSDLVNRLTPQQKAIGAAGLVTAASAPLFMGGEEQPPTNQAVLPAAKHQTAQPQIPQPEQQPTVAKSLNAVAAAPKQQAEPEVQPDLVNAAVPSQPKENDFADRLAAAQEQDAKNQLLFGMLKAAQTGGSALASSKADTSFADAQLQKANEAVNRLKTGMDLTEENANIQEKEQKRDPNSKTSKLYQDMLKMLKPDMNVTGLSAEQVEKVFPQIGTIIGRQESIEARKEVARENALNRQLQRDLARESKLSDLNTKRLDKLNEKITEDVASGRSAFGQAAKNMQAISNVKALLEGNQDPNSIDNRQISEVARVLDRVLSGGSPTISGTAHLTPETARMKIAQLLEYATNKRQGAQAGSFIKNFQHTLDREEAQSKKQILKTQKELLSGVSDIAKTNPDRIQAMLEARGIKGNFNENGVFIPEGLESEQKHSAELTTNNKGNEERIQVISPEGKTGSIPASKLKDALNRGFKQVK